MWNLKYGTNERFGATETGSQTEHRLAVTKGEGNKGGKDWEFGVGICTLLHLKWINNKVLLYSTGNYIQLLGINHKGKYEKKKKRMYNRLPK